MRSRGIAVTQGLEHAGDIVHGWQDSIDSLWFQCGGPLSPKLFCGELAFSYVPRVANVAATIALGMGAASRIHECRTRLPALLQPL
jgi:hypothetical protein